jgi:hypothetical protein
MSDAIDCFVKLPSNMRATPLFEALAAERVAAKRSLNGDGDLRTLIDSDRFIGVISGTGLDREVLYFAGISVGLGRPTLLICRPSMRTKIDAPGAVLVAIGMNEVRAIKLHVNVFLKTSSTDLFKLSHQERKQSRYRGSDVYHTKFHSALEQQVYDIFRDAEVPIIYSDARRIEEDGTPPNIKTKRQYFPDFLIDASSITDLEFKDAVIEVKGRVTNPKDIEKQVQLYANKVRAKLSIVVTDGRLPSHNSPRTGVVWITIQKLSECLTFGNFLEYIRDFRTGHTGGDE